MTYLQFRDAIGRELRRNPDGLTWSQLQQRLELPYERPCPTWTKRLEGEIRLTRTKLLGRARLLWRVPDSKRQRSTGPKVKAKGAGKS
jgi:hypothetical protein